VSPPAPRRPRWPLYGGLIAVVVVTFSAAALLYPRLTGTDTAATGSTAQPPTTSPAADATGSSTDPSADPLSPGASGGPTGSSGGPTTTRGTDQPAPSGPRIVYLRVKQSVKCPQGSDQGRPLVLEWHAAGGVTKMALSVDNPGLVGSYRTYDGPDGSETFSNFSCQPPPGTKQSHTFTIYTVGGGAQKSKTLVITATSNSLETSAPTSSPST
jgi:hypothetical protein